MFSILKALVARLLCNNFSGRILGLILSDKISFFKNIKVLTDSQFVTPYIKSLIFWGIYEGSEARSVLNFIDDKHDIVELGSSLGVISSLAGKFKGNKKIICVEINSNLIPVIEKNLDYNRIKNYSIKNIAIGNSSSLWFTPGLHSSQGKVDDKATYNSKKIETITLSNLLIEEQIENYKLICDIEGSEIDILLNDTESLKNCQTLIIETHKVERNGIVFLPSDMKAIIINLGFICIEERDVNFVFKKV